MRVHLSKFVFAVALAVSVWTVAGIPPASAQNTGKEAAQAVPTSPEDLDLVAVGTVTSIKKSDMIELNGKTLYRLDQIRVPIYYEEQAIDYLQKSLLNKKVGVYAVKKAKNGLTDRYGNPVGHMMREDGIWVQADMISRGLAWAYSTDTNNILSRPLYNYEETARALKSGFWEKPEYAIKDKTNIGKYPNSYQIYEGKISSVNGKGENYTFYCDTEKKRGAAFVFTISKQRGGAFIPEGERSFPGWSWAGAQIRVRGWVEKDGNSPPTVEVTHPAQLEMIDSSSSAEAPL